MKNLKTFLNIAFIATTLLFISCNNDDVQIIVEDLTIDFNENPTNGQTVGTVQTNGSGDFNITSQTPAGALNINTSTGELTVADATLFDFETNPVIIATISVVGGANTGSVTINLTNVNELSIQDLNTTIDENSTNGQYIGTVQADGDGTISFSITSQTPSGALNIDANTGELTVADVMLFDYETNPVITATISVDNSVSTESAIATINLNNLNEIGDFNHGGVIFWIDPTDDTHGLVCAVNDQSIAAEWGCENVAVATATAFGSGSTNVEAIEAACTTAGTAADIVSNLSMNGFDDWFFPSRFEMDYVYSNRTIINTTAIVNGGGNLSNGKYWTSSQFNEYLAISYRFSDGVSDVDPKSTTLNVRAIRAF